MDVCQEETEFKWLEAAKTYEKKLKSESPVGALAGESWQKIGFCYSRASRQAKDVEEFKTLRRFGTRAYERAAEYYKETGKKEYEGKSVFCLAIAEFLRSWLAVDSSEKIKILNGCIEIVRKALETFQKVGDKLGYGRTANLMTDVLYERMTVASTAAEKNKFSEEGLESANEAISILSKLDNEEELLTAYSLASIHSWYASNINEDQKTRDKFAEKSIKYADKAIALADKVADPYLFSLSRWAGVYSYLYFKDDIDVSMKFAREMYEKASGIKDNYLVGIASFLLAYVADLSVECEADPTKRKKLTESLVKYSEKGVHHLNLVFQDSLVAECYEIAAQTYCTLASDYAINRSEKVVYLEKALNLGRKGLEHANRSGTPESMLTALHVLGKVYYYRSNLEARKNRKINLLKSALDYRRQHVETAKRTFPSNAWMQGVSQAYAGQIQSDLSEIESEEKAKISYLEKAIADMDDGVSKCKNWIATCDVPSVVAVVAKFEDSFGGILVENYSLTDEKANLDRANEVYSDAAESYKKVDFPSRVAESYWKIAKNLDGVSIFDQAAKNFEHAFAAFKVAAKKIKQFNDFYIDYAYYMKAWSEIEFAKCAHNSEEYQMAMDQYEKASRLLRKSKSWMYLSLNFYAWSILEQAEDFSRKERSEEAVKAFENASKYLKESKRILGVKLADVENEDEKDLITRLIQALEARMEYCRGRISVEEARILDKKGEHLRSSREYDDAAATFHELSLSDVGQIGKEAKPLSYLCQAWAKMTMAEARASPIMYEEAADLFKLAKDYSFKESSGLLAMGHSSFCKAMEAGTEFELTRSSTMYDEAVRYLESAADFYLKAGFETTSDYATAIQRLFDAYYFMASAKRERESKKQLKYYSMAEKVLQNAVEFFEKAKVHDKSLEASNLLHRVKEERQFAMSLTDIFHAPAITSSTAAFSSFASVEESAAGLERFEKAAVQVKLVPQKTEISVGDEVGIKFQMVNVGKEPVSLIRVENLISSGFQLVDKPDYCQFEDGTLVMKGKTLKPLKMEEISFTLKSFKKGTMEVKPRIVCLDWIGHEAAFEPEPVIFNVASAVLPGRVPTGYADLDNLLLGGIPENYAVVLASPATDEREQLIRKFLEFGAKNGQITYYISSWVGNVEDLVEKHQSNFNVFVCNPRSDVMISDLPNVYKIAGVERITDLDIALIRSYRKMDKSIEGPKRICISTVSDVLLEQHAVMTRKWLSSLLPDLKAKGFTTLAVVNPDMHPREEVQAILSLFDGEIRIKEKETQKGLEQRLRIRKLFNKRYLENEIVLTREKLER